MFILLTQSWDKKSVLINSEKIVSIHRASKDTCVSLGEMEDGESVNLRVTEPLVEIISQFSGLVPCSAVLLNSVAKEGLL